MPYQDVYYTKNAILRMFSYLCFKCWQTTGRLLNSWIGYQKSYIEINWFSDNVQSGIFASEHEGEIKVNEINDFVTSPYSNTIFYLFHLNP